MSRRRSSCRRSIGSASTRLAERRELTVDGLAETHWVGVYGIEDGLVRRLEIFALEDFDAALAHYDELVAGAGTT